MSLYKNLNLFGSGPHRFHVHVAAQRHQIHLMPGADGAAATPLGREARRIDQAGTLRGDDAQALRDQIAAIESAMDGSSGELVDEHGRAWPATLMVDFKPGALRRVGPRFACDYVARYLQLEP
jgi:hypothetical protein